MRKLLVILDVIKYYMLVFRKCQVLDKKGRILEHFNQTLYLTGRIIQVLDPPRVLGPRRVPGPPRILDPPKVLGSPRVLGHHRVLDPGSCFSGMPF